MAKPRTSNRPGPSDDEIRRLTLDIMRKVVDGARAASPSSPQRTIDYCPPELRYRRDDRA